jgi:chemotaxis protein MotB
MPRKKKQPEHANHERWLVSYADFITLLFAFFVVMFSVSQVDAQKMGRFVESVQASFELRGPFSTSNNSFYSDASSTSSSSNGRPVIVPTFEILPLQIQDGIRLSEIQSAAEKILANANLRDRVKVRMESRGLTVSLPETGFFAAGSAELRPVARPVALEIAALLKPIPNRILVEGHTDDVPIRGGPYETNWELSTARATGVVRMLIQEVGIEPARLSAAGYAEFQPVSSNETPEGRALNRRVDLVVLSEQPPQLVNLSDSPERMREATEHAAARRSRRGGQEAARGGHEPAQGEHGPGQGEHGPGQGEPAALPTD